MIVSQPASRHRVRRTVPSVLKDLFAFLGTRMLVILGIGSIAIAGVVGASAATLGGLRTNDLGASSATIASHLAGISVTWGSRWSGTALVMDSITLTTAVGQPFVVGEVIKGSIINTAGTALCTVSYTVATAGTTQVLSRTIIEASCGTTPFAYSSIDRVALVVTK